MTNEQLESFIDAQYDKGFRQWASYSDMKAIPDDLMDAMMDECINYCYGSANLVFEFHSSTSGMYSSWSVEISSSCTIYLDKKQPKGYAGTLSAALANFILKGRISREEYKPKHKKYMSSDWPHTTAGNPL